MWLCVKLAIDSVPGGHTDMRPVSSESIEPEGVQSEKKIFRKVTSGQITEQKCYATNAFLWEKFLNIYSPLILKGPNSSFYITYGPKYKSMI